VDLVSKPDIMAPMHGLHVQLPIILVVSHSHLFLMSFSGFVIV